MKIYIVSCNPGRIERLTKASESLHLDFEVVDSPLKNDEEVLSRGKRAFQLNKSYHTGFAATIGHMRCMRRFINSNEPLCMIIEDDVRFHKQFNEIVSVVTEYINSSNANVVSLGYVNFPNSYDVKTLPNGLKLIENVKLGNPWGCQCYMIKREYAISFLDKFETGEVTENYSNNFVTDWVIFDPIVGCCRSTLLSPIVIEDNNEQSIAGDNTNKPNLLSRLNRDDFLF